MTIVVSAVRQHAVHAEFPMDRGYKGYGTAVPICSQTSRPVHCAIAKEAMVVVCIHAARSQHSRNVPQLKPPNLKQSPHVVRYMALQVLKTVLHVHTGEPEPRAERRNHTHLSAEHACAASFSIFHLPCCAIPPVPCHSRRPPPKGLPSYHSYLAYRSLYTPPSSS